MASFTEFATNVLLWHNQHLSQKELAMSRTRKQAGFAEHSQTSYKAELREELLPRPPRYEKLKLGNGGRFVIPAAMREEMGVKPGEDLILCIENGELRVRSWLRNLRRIQSDLSALKEPGESVVDDFQKERREEQRRSDKRFDRLHAEGMAIKNAPK
jgi:bifunctional DNA-binding transcriptional regulator/antitoxin component of YhaV-PrlF toxin-antitoxin module